MWIVFKLHILTSASSDALLLLRARRVAAVPTTVAAIAIETAVSAKAGIAVDDLLAFSSCDDFKSKKEIDFKNLASLTSIPKN